MSRRNLTDELASETEVGINDGAGAIAGRHCHREDRQHERVELLPNRHKTGGVQLVSRR